MSNLSVQIASGDALDVRAFSVEEQLSSFFRVTLTVRSRNADVDFDAVIGAPAGFTVQGARSWSGVCEEMQQLHAEETGLSTYRLSIVPRFWLLKHRRNHRIFQQLSEIEIVLLLLAEWGIVPELRIDAAAYKKRKYRVQYAETDFDFVNRLLEDAGVSYLFAPDSGALVLDDAPHRRPPRMPLPYRDNPTQHRSQVHATRVEVKRGVSPGRYTVKDHDYRKPPEYPLLASAQGGLATEQLLEAFHYVPGAFLFRSQASGDTPVADDKGATRSDEKEAKLIAQKRLDAKRVQAKQCHFVANALDVAAGTVLSFADHPRSDLSIGKTWLVQHAHLTGTHDGEWTVQADAVSTDTAYRPALVTAKPRAEGSESATVVGPKGEEIHCDEFGRVRVQFHWDRYGTRDDKSSCWIHVNQPWSGAGYGGTNLPRVGQEVIVDFLNGDPDRPVILGRVYTALQKTPYKLPENKTQSGWKSNSTMGTGGFNEIMMQDAAGQEQLRIQAQRDMASLVKHDQTVAVQNDRTVAITHEDAETVGANQTLGVTGSRTVVVKGNEERTINGMAGMTTTVTLGAYTLDVKDSITLVCGGSTIYMTSGFIIVQTARLFLNPGDLALKNAMSGKGLPEPAAEREARELKAKEKADAEKAAEMKLIMRAFNEGADVDDSPQLP